MRQHGPVRGEYVNIPGAPSTLAGSLARSSSASRPCGVVDVHRFLHEPLRVALRIPVPGGQRDDVLVPAGEPKIRPSWSCSQAEGVNDGQPEEAESRIRCSQVGNVERDDVVSEQGIDASPKLSRAESAWGRVRVGPGKVTDSLRSDRTPPSALIVSSPGRTSRSTDRQEIGRGQAVVLTLPLSMTMRRPRCTTRSAGTPRRRFSILSSLVGVAGTWTSLAAIGLGLETYDRRRVHHSAITAAQMAILLAELAKLTVPETAAIPSLDPAYYGLETGCFSALD